MFSCCPRLINFVASLAICITCLLAGNWFGSRNHSPRTSTANAWQNMLPAAYLTDSAARGKNISIATGQIDTNIDGLFILDHLTGNLQCFVLNARSGNIGAVYRTNVLNDLGAQDRSDVDYVLVTGNFDFSRVGRSGQNQFAQCICYVGESNSGKFCGYSFGFNATGAARGEVQMGELARVMAFSIRDESIIRD